METGQGDGREEILFVTKEMKIMFGRKAKPCMVFEYGCFKPIAGFNEMIEEMLRRNRYWNKLVEIDRKYSSKVKDVLTVPADPKISEIRAKIESLRQQIKDRRKENRSGKVDCADLEKQVSELKKQLQIVKPLVKEERKRIAEANREKLKAIEKERLEAVKEARKTSGLYWCNYDEVEMHYETARKRALKTGRELKFHRFDGQGKVTVRLRENGMSGPWGMPVKNAFKPNNAFWFDPVPEEAWFHPKRSVRRKLARTKVRLRVGSDENRNPVWVELPVIMHRPMPATSEIRSASIVREKVGRRFRYKLVVTVTIPEEISHIKRAKVDTVGIDIGWRSVPEGLRVVYWYDETGNSGKLVHPAIKDFIKITEDGKSGQLILPHKIINAFKKIDDLKSIRDQHFNEAKEILKKWVDETSDADWIKDETKDILKWRNHNRLAKLIYKWRENRVPNDDRILDILEEWLKKEKHLYDWEANLRDKTIRFRREIYRVFAAQIASTYSKVILEDFDLRNVLEKPDPEEGTQGSIEPNYQRFVAAVSVLREALENACRREKTEIIYVDPVNTTIQCNKCGHVEKFDAAAHLIRTCPACGEIWDQDYNAAKVLLERGTEISKIT